MIMDVTTKKYPAISNGLPESYLGLGLEPIIPEEVQSLEDFARQEKMFQHFESAGKLFHNLANWHEGQNESLLRNKWEKAGKFHLLAAECFISCAEKNLPGHNWHELAGLEYTRSVECYLNNPEDIYFHREAFNKAIKQFKLIPKVEYGIKSTRIDDVKKLSTHLIDIKYKQIIHLLEDRGFTVEYDKLTIEYTKWKANTSNSTARKLWYWFWGLTSNYGTSVIRWILWCFCVVTFYTFLYYFTTLETERGFTGFSRIIERFYFSVVTFTTLGFGDILPSTAFGMTLVVTEVLFGNLMFWVMMTILGKKIFR
jgi:Ion channel